MARRWVSVALACRTFDVSETCYGYSSLLSDENEEIVDLLVGLTEARKTWRFGLCFLQLSNVHGHPWNHKRVHQIYCELELNLHIKPRKWLKLDKPDALAVPNAPNVTWSMDFMADHLSDGLAFRLLNMLDEFKRKSLGIEVDFSLPGERVIRSLNWIIDSGGNQEPFGLTIGRSILVERCWNRLRNKVLSSSTSNPESHDRTLTSSAITTVRHKSLDQHIIEYIEEAKDFATQWLWTYNNDHPKMGIGGITPARKLKIAASVLHPHPVKNGGLPDSLNAFFQASLSEDRSACSSQNTPS